MIRMDRFRIAPQVDAALKNKEPVVALESTVLAHGLPFPVNLETARECEKAVRQEGATPATIGIVEGAPVVGLADEQLEIFARGQDEAGTRIEKVSLNNLAAVILRRSWGATTVAATMQIAHRAGIRVFATGGIGGVHRGAVHSFDVSADLTALSRIPIICVCAGAKVILDLHKTVEKLETLGVPIVGYQTDEFPAFYCRDSGLAVTLTVQTPGEAGELAEHHWRSGLATAVLVCVPVPEESQLPAREVERATEEAVKMAALAGIRGKALTPFLLAQLEEISGGKTLDANRDLLINNAAVAARIAKAMG